MLSELIHKLHNIALGRHGQETESLLLGIIQRADLKPGGRKKSFQPKDYEGAIEEHMARGGIITLHDQVTSISVRDGKFVIHAGSPKSKGDLMCDYEQVPGGTVQQIVEYFTETKEVADPYAQGADDALGGQSLTDNPYDPNEQEDAHLSWNDGFKSLEEAD